MSISRRIRFLWRTRRYSRHIIRAISLRFGFWPLLLHCKFDFIGFVGLRRHYDDVMTGQVVIGPSVLFVHLPENQHLLHISGFSGESVCHVYTLVASTCLESKVVRTYMGVPEDTKVTKELITHFQNPNYRG